MPMVSASPASEVAARYIGAWLRHDADGLAAMFGSSGTYTDSTTAKPLTGPAIAAHAGQLFDAFPDLTFDRIREFQSGTNTVVIEWVMRGTNTGSLRGARPTARVIALPGIDVLTTIGDHVASIVGYFDRQLLLEQLGLRLIPVPASTDTLAFGTATYLAARQEGTPGAVALTTIEVASEAEGREVQERTRAMLPELAAMPGFLGFMGVIVGDRLHTLTAWSTPEDAQQVGDSREHAAAMRRVFLEHLGRAGRVTVWTPHRWNPGWIRCPGCGAVARPTGPHDACSCGHILPAVSRFW